MRGRLLLVVLAFVFVAVFSFAGTVTIKVVNSQKTDVPTPFVITMGRLLELVGEDFDANWESIRVYSGGKEIPYQVDDIDGNKKISYSDRLIFLFKNEAKIVVSDDMDMEFPEYKASFKIEEKKGEKYIESLDFPFVVEVDDHGLTHVVKYKNVEGNIIRELGIARVAGWVGSTYYIDGKLGNHEEKVSYSFTPADVRVLKPGPVCTTVVSKLRSNTFLGLTQTIISHVFKTGEVLVYVNFSFKTYADLMKLQIMATHPLTDIDSDALHILPVFRRLVWAEQLGTTVYDYWFNKGAIEMVDNKPYIVFPATSNMKPLWWGATYIFASMEDWRANYSKKYKLFVAEILDKHPLVSADFKKFVFGNTWVYESREFRDGIFRWIPDEFNAYAPTEGIIPKGIPNWVAHYKAGDSVTFIRLFSVKDAPNVQQTVRYLEKRKEDFQSVRIEK